MHDTIGEETVSMAEHINSKTDMLSRILKKMMKETTYTPTDRYEKWRTKPLHGQFPRMVNEIGTSQTWQWLKGSNIKGPTEGLIIAAQDQCLMTNSYRKEILKQNVSPNCRMCHTRPETINHILSECSTMALKQYLIRHNNIARSIHWSLCNKYNIKTDARWYEHQPEKNKVMENEHVKILWDFSIQTDKVISARRPDITVVNKTAKTVTIIDVAVPADKRVSLKETEKIEKYKDLAIELTRIWGMRTRIIPVVVGALGTLSSNSEKWVKELHASITNKDIQRIALLGSAFILRRVLGKYEGAVASGSG